MSKVRLSSVLTSAGVLTSRGATLLQLAFVNAPPDPGRGFSGRGSRCGVQPMGAQRAAAAALVSAGFFSEATGFGPGGEHVHAITVQGEAALSSYYDSRGEARPAGLRTSSGVRAESAPTIWQPIVSAEAPAIESVNHPPHYGGDTTYEVIKVLRAWGLDGSFELGSAAKYLARLGKKNGADPIEDLKKARWYIDSKIAELVAERAKKGS